MNKPEKNKGGRPTSMTKEVLSKLDYAFSIGCSDKEAYAHANISKDTFYRYQENTKGYREYKELLKQKPFLKARASIDAGLKNPKIALKYMKYKRSKEFNTKQVIDANITGDISLGGAFDANKGK